MKKKLKSQLTIIEDLGYKTLNGKRVPFVKCLCTCGNIKDIRKYCVTSGATLSCGCLKIPPLTKTHGMSYTKTYSTWSSMKNRCNKKSNREYEHYGGRGIKVCERWNKFENFLEDMGDRPEKRSLDRIDNNGNYCKENCRWATDLEQGNNTSRNVFVTFNGETLSVSQWALKLGLNKKTFATRIKTGMPLSRAFSKKLLVKNK